MHTPAKPTSPPPPPTFLDTLERLLLRAILIAVALLAALIGFAAWHTRSTAAARGAAAVQPTQAPTTTAISIVVDFGDGAQKRLSGIAFTQGMTVLDAMNLARVAQHPIHFQASGRAETALISQIDDVANEPGTAGPKSRAWQYWVNQQYGMSSVGAATLQPGDRISWAFQEYKPDPGPPPQ